MNYTLVGEVPGVGNSSLSTIYSLLDNDPLPGSGMYRLTQVDVNGKKEGLGSISVRAKEEDLVGISYMYPNPVVEMIHVTYRLPEGSTEATLSVLNLLGEIVLKKEDLQLTATTIDVSGLSQGTYFLKISSGSRSDVEKIIIQR